MSPASPLHILGTGSLSAAGNSPAAAWRSYTSGAPTWTTDSATGLPIYRVTGLPEDDAVARFVQEQGADRATHLALRAAEQAVMEADWRGKDFAILVGCSRGPTGNWETEYGRFLQEGRVSAKTSPRTTLGSIGFALARYFGTSAVSTSMSVTCSSGLHALLHGVALLRAGMAERVLVGGAEAPLTSFTLRQLAALRVYAKVPAVGEHACRPLATPASGMAVGEGAAFFALSLAGNSDSPILREITFAQEHSPSLTGISPEGVALQTTMGRLLKEAGSSPDLVVAHAPGTKRGDEAERTALQSLVSTCGRAQVTSGKWATGHTFGASGPLGLDLALQILWQGEAEKLHYLPATGTINSVLVNATGFGGNVASVLVERNFRQD